MVEVVSALRDPLFARPAAKVLLAMVLVEANRRTAIEAEAVAAAVEAVVSSAGGAKGASTAERALAALELICTVEEGLTEVRKHALSAPAMASAVESMQGRGKECAIGVLSSVYAGDQAKDAPDEVVRAVMVAMQGECSARGRRKGAMLLRALQECGRLDLDLNFEG